MIPAGGMAHSNRVRLPPLGDFLWVADVHGTPSPCPESRGPRKGSHLLSPLQGEEEGNKKGKESFISHNMSVKLSLSHMKC